VNSPFFNRVKSTLGLSTDRLKDASHATREADKADRKAQRARAAEVRKNEALALSQQHEAADLAADRADEAKAAEARASLSRAIAADTFAAVAEAFSTFNTEPTRASAIALGKVVDDANSKALEALGEPISERLIFLAFAAPLAEQHPELVNVLFIDHSGWQTQHGAAVIEAAKPRALGLVDVPRLNAAVLALEALIAQLAVGAIHGAPSENALAEFQILCEHSSKQDALSAVESRRAQVRSGALVSAAPALKNIERDGNVLIAKVQRDTATEDPAPAFEPLQT
jgi:hypothetical protein